MVDGVGAMCIDDAAVALCGVTPQGFVDLLYH